MINIFDKTATKFIASLLVNGLLAAKIIHPDSQDLWVNGIAEIIGYIGIIITILISLHHSYINKREQATQETIEESLEEKSVTVAAGQPVSVVSFIPEQK